jgi:hypothetical protein
MYCPNPDCPEHQLTGTSNEYADNVARCPICGTRLEPEGPSFAPRPASPRKSVPAGKDLPYWREYRRRRSWYWAAYGAFFPYGIILLALVDPTAHGRSGLGMVLGFVPYFVFVAIAAIRFLRWRCPRCKQPFHSWFFITWPYGRACLHCRLPLWQEAGRGKVA